MSIKKARVALIRLLSPQFTIVNGYGTTFDNNTMHKAEVALAMGEAQAN